MARMIPTIISGDTKSSAERKIFKWFSEAPGTDDWIVLHSLGISQHESLIHGEVDFLVIAPKLGVFALEVKGGRVKREEGTWVFIDRYDNATKKQRGPIDQAWDAIHSIMDTYVPMRADAEHSRVRKLLYGIGVMFPDIDYESVGVDEEPWQVFDCKDGNNVKQYIQRLSQGSIQKWEETYGPFPSEKLPSVQDAKYLLSILRRDFDKAVAMRAKINYAEQELLELTERQYKCLDQIEENRRGLVYGPAGTGKTLLAVEQTKKSTLMGRKVALICFNSNLGKWFQDYFSTAPETIRPEFVGTFHGLLTDIAKKAGKLSYVPTDDNEKKEFFSNTLPALVEEILLENPIEFDEIIVDEAQDLIKPKYVDIIDLMLVKGFDHGRWKFFGDFSRQAIYADGASGQELIDYLEDRTSFIRCKLTENCRNTKQICQEIQTVTGFEASSDLWSKIEGIPVDYRVFKNEDEELDILESLLAELDDKNIDKGDITILSPIRRENSVVDRVSNYKVKDYAFNVRNQITFSTVQSFKGLENSIIILTDIESFGSEQLMYVALSRARSALFVLETKSANNEYNQLLARRLLNGKG